MELQNSKDIHGKYLNDIEINPYKANKNVVGGAEVGSLHTVDLEI